MSIFGVKRVGKTSLIQRYISDIFDINSKSTLGAAIHVKYLKIQDKTILLQIWDFGGEEKFQFLLPSYAYGSFGAIFMYDLTQRESLEKYRDWISVFKAGLREQQLDVPILLVGGKLDLEHNRTVFREDIEGVLKSGLFFDVLECSAKTGKNIDRIFEVLLNEIINRVCII